MPQLAQIKRRIKTTKSIEKITHAMQLIAISTHMRLKSQETPITRCWHTISNIIQATDITTNMQSILTPTQNNPHTLAIIIGSQKGLCGNFNTALLNFFMKQSEKQRFSTIVVGRKMISLVEKKVTTKPIAIHEKINTRNFLSITEQIVEQIISAESPYTQVIVFSNHAKSFFVQQPQQTALIPFSHYKKGHKNESTDSQEREEYIWEQEPQKICDTLAQEYLISSIRYLLFDSLLAEHSARFISMDNATRNARNLISTTQMLYNKARQAKITKELIELSSNF